MFRLFVIAAAIAWTQFAPSQAHAQQYCSSRSALTKHLLARYAESPVSQGLSVKGTLLEVFAAKDGSSWTLVETLPIGVSCVRATGESWSNNPTLASDPGVYDKSF
ncbi:MAG: hypothetical protein IH905_10110 [Proteobacteria bacterium]|nr:hypothetical protein [Pseudomonadota bacterium]